MAYDRKTNTMKLQIAAKLLRHTESGPMVCRADSMEYNRETMQLYMVGNTSVAFKGNRFQSASISIDLETEEIILEGSISGAFSG